MELTYTTRNGRITVTLNGSTQRDLWKQLAEFQEVFENISCTVGNKSSDNVQFVVREVEKDGKKYEYFELRCKDRGELFGYRKDFGAHQQGGTLFPKLKDKNGAWLENNGWYKFSGKSQDDDDSGSDSGSGTPF